MPLKKSAAKKLAVEQKDQESPDEAVAERGGMGEGMACWPLNQVYKVSLWKGDFRNSTTNSCHYLTMPHTSHMQLLHHLQMFQGTLAPPLGETLEDSMNNHAAIII